MRKNHSASQVLKLLAMARFALLGGNFQNISVLLLIDRPLLPKLPESEVVWLAEIVQKEVNCGWILRQDGQFIMACAELVKIPLCWSY